MNYIDLTAEDEKKPLILQRADPYVYYHTDGYYYFTASSPEYDRIELRRAWSIKALADAEPLVIWRKHATGQMSYHIWAPELHFVGGKWYIYFAAGRAEDRELPDRRSRPPQGLRPGCGPDRQGTAPICSSCTRPRRCGCIRWGTAALPRQ